MTFAKLVVFDLDDTLIATSDAVLRARECVLREFLGLVTAAQLGQAQAAWQRLTWYYGPDDRLGIYTALGRTFERVESSFTERTLVAARYEEVMAENLRLTAGAEVALDTLRAKGILLGLLTNGAPARQQQKIDQTGLARWFPPDLIVISEPGSPGAKPHPTAILRMCTLAGVASSETVAVGDRVTDVIAGNLAGCHTVYYYGSPLEVRLPSPVGILSVEIPEIAIRDLSALPEILSGPNDTIIRAY